MTKPKDLGTRLMISPPVKKSNLNPEESKNFCPVSKSLFISKLVELVEPTAESKFQKSKEN